MTILLGGSKASSEGAGAGGSPVTFTLTCGATGYKRGVIGNISPDPSILGNTIDGIYILNPAPGVVYLVVEQIGGGTTDPDRLTSITIDGISGPDTYLMADADGTNIYGTNNWYWDVTADDPLFSASSTAYPVSIAFP